MSQSLAATLLMLSNESNEEAIEQAIMEGEIETTPGLETVSDVIEHAVKAEVVAEQLEELAEKAEEVAAEDKEYLLNEVSNEAFAMTFRNIMVSNGLGVKATSFESAHTNGEKMLGLAADSRAVAVGVRQLQDNLLDFSPEGKVLSFLRRDKAKLQRAFSDLKAISLREDELKAKLGEGVRVTDKSQIKFFFRGGEPVSSIAKEIEYDVKLLVTAHKQLEDVLGKLKTASANGGSSDDVTVPDFTIVNEPLLGDRKYGEGAWLPSQRTSHLTAGQTIKGALWANLASLPLGIIVGAALTPVAGPIAAGVAGYGVFMAQYVPRLMNVGMVKTSKVISFEGLAKVTGSIGQLVDLTNRSRFDTIVAEILTKSTAENTASFKKAVTALSKVYETLYDHAYFLTTRTASLMKTIEK